MNEHTLFLETLALPADQRNAFLDQACAGRPELRAAVEARLRAHEQAETPPDRPQGSSEATTDFNPARAHNQPDPPADPEQTATIGSELRHDAIHPEPDTAETLDPPPPDAGRARGDDQPGSIPPGLVIAGRYELLEKLGEGGMGEVWVAKQTEPVKRKVALKLIKPGMDSCAVLQRFEQERQALAVMDHPNIARVLDGGLTADNRPFFVMELVNGLPLTKFCDEARLTPRERLELFVPICQAVQHAHQKGIVHRDLKPANILVTLIDGRPVPKVIDFGVAKATAGKLTDESLSTQFGAVVGTLEYMSPEQAGFAGEDIDTRADIYSLGVILYELLTGLRPIDRKRLHKAALTEMIRIIREEEPSKPSTRLSTDDSAPSMAALRQTEPKKLAAMLRGDLDWIIMKCLEKPRERRYETANGLARDLQRFLADEPVEARPPSPGYRISKFIRRHKGQVLAASLVLLALLGGIAGTTAGFLRAEEKRREAEAAARAESLAKIDAETRRLEAEQQRARAETREQQAIDAVKRFRDAVADNPMLKNSPELEDLRKTLLKEPLAFFKTLREQLQADNDTRPEALARLADAAHDYAHLTNEIGNPEDGLKAHDECRALWMGLTRADPSNPDYEAELARIESCRGNFLSKMGNVAGSRRAYDTALQIQERLARDHPSVTAYAQDLAGTHQNLGLLLQITGDTAGARRAYDAALQIQERLARDHPAVTAYAQDLASTHTYLGLLLAASGDPAGARRAYDAARVIQERLARDHPSVTAYARDLATTHNNLGLLLADTGDPAGARRAYDAALQIRERLARDHPAVTLYAHELAMTHNNLGALLYTTGDPAGARRGFEAVREIQERLARDHPSVTAYARDLASTHNNLGLLLKDTGDPAGARRAFDAALQIQERLARDHPAVTLYAQDQASTHNNLGVLLRATGDPAGARRAYDAAREIQERLARDHPAVTAYAQDLASTHNNLGNLLYTTGDPAGARRAYDAAREIQERLARDHPEMPDVASELGGTLNNLAGLDLAARRWLPARALLKQAVTRQKQALAANPRNPQYRQFLANHLANLIQAASALGNDAEAAEARRELAELSASDPRFQALDARLKAVIGGEKPKDNAERLALAERAYDTQHYALAARLWGEALENDPTLANDRQAQHRYSAACAAALAASESRAGQVGADPPVPPTDAERASFRNQALDYLQAELDLWTKILESANEQQRSATAQTLAHWQNDTDLASLRGDEIDTLPEPEHAPWRALWDQVEALRQLAVGEVKQATKENPDPGFPVDPFAK
jgi:serine/threonine protein kinase/tetratricopeptide (TPR) repeat protein